MRRFGAMAASLFVFAGALGADGAEKPVSLGEVSAHVARHDFDVARVLRATAEQELATLELGRKKPREKVIVSVSLVRMDDETNAATCVVSASLRTARTGNVFAVVEGKARASQPQANADENALRGAVRGAMLRVPEALQGVP